MSKSDCKGKDVSKDKGSSKGKNNLDKKNEYVNTQQCTKMIEEDGTTFLSHNSFNHQIELFSIIGEIEGHEILGSNTKSTKYEHILPKLAQIEDDQSIDGVMILLNTVGGDVEAGLAIAEMIASLEKPTVSLVLGGSHSIGVPIAVSTDYSFIVETATMVIHPVRLNGLVIGTPSTYDYFKSIQDRVTGFVVSHSNIEKKQFDRLLMETKVLTKDVGSVLTGPKAVQYGLIDEVGGIHDATLRLHQLIDDKLKI